MPPSSLSRFELQTLRLLAARGEASARQLHSDLEDPPGYSTVRKILERLEAKGAVTRVRLEGKAWIYRPTAGLRTTFQAEVRRFLDTVFGGAAGPLVSHLVDMKALSLDDLKQAETQLKGAPSRKERK